jgi:chemotaxis response regulator CheB
MSLRVLVADDAIFFRCLLAEVLASLPGVEVVGTAANGRVAVRKVRELHPDVLTLDIEMPEMDGLAVLDELRRGGDNIETIVVSALSRTRPATENTHDWNWSAGCRWKCWCDTSRLPERSGRSGTRSAP